VSTAEAHPRFIPSPQFSVEDVDPVLAQTWLNSNTRNRSLRPRRVAALAKDMTNGDFLLTGEAIKFAVDGTLLDGQHRLAAIVESGVTVTLAVIRGLEPITQDVMDTGAARSAGDQLKLAGHSNTTALAALARWVTLWDEGLISSGDWKVYAITHSEIKRAIEQDPTLAQSVSIAKRFRGIDMPNAAISTSYHLCRRVDEDGAFEFFSRAADGVSLPPGSPILAMRNRFSELRRNRTHLTVPIYLSLTLRAWNAWRQGRTMASIPLFRDGAPIPVPEPK
jgi:hypothetical protein